MQMDSIQIVFAEIDKAYFFQRFSEANDLFRPHSEIIEFTHYLTDNRYSGFFIYHVFLL